MTRSFSVRARLDVLAVGLPQVEVLRGYPCKFLLVGSALHKAKPRDYDVLGVLTDEQFAKHFLNAVRWKQEGESGFWSQDRYRWSAASIAVNDGLAAATDLNIDFKFWPERYVYGKRRVIESGVRMAESGPG